MTVIDWQFTVFFCGDLSDQRSSRDRLFSHPLRYTGYRATAMAALRRAPAHYFRYSYPFSRWYDTGVTDTESDYSGKRMTRDSNVWTYQY